MLLQTIIFTLTLLKWWGDINQTNEMSGSKSLFVTCNLTTSNTKLSPVIDTQRISMITVQNRLNSPTSINHPNFKNDESSSGSSQVLFTVQDQLY